MRRAARVDTNQAEIVAALREVGASVQPLHQVGGGCPDLLCGIAGHNVLIEVKSDDGMLTPEQVVWHTSWAGQVAVCRSIDEALIAVGLM